MIKVEAPSLQEAYSKAAAELSCSVIDLEITILQNGSGGFLGMFKKNAIIEVYRKGTKPVQREVVEKKEFESAPKTSVTQTNSTSGSEEKRSERNKRNRNRRNKSKNKEQTKEEIAPQKVDHHETKEAPVQRVDKKEMPKAAPIAPREPRHTVVASPVEQTFQYPKREVNEVVDEVRANVCNLFQYSCFSLDVPTVSKYDDETILIEFSGEDAALLIGKEGYRYKALSYLLYNWINLKYGLNIRLEIAEFLKNQEEMIEKYLVPVIERIRTSGRGQTKILDGVLIKIALESLREAFPEKYVGIKSGREGGKFIVVNDFNRKNA